MISFSCPSCQKTLKVKDELAGKRIRCPGCQQVQEVPQTSVDTATAVRCPAAGHPQAEDATLPPAPRSTSRTEDATVPPRHSSPPGPTITYQAAEDGCAPDFSEVIKAGSAYEVGSEIARGGMGAVMRAVDQDIRREVAVKFLLNHADERLKARFVEEAQITGQLEHPNIVPIHQLGVHEDGRCFFSMKMVKGRSLAEILKGEPGASATGEFTLGRLLTIFSNICNALAYAHSRGVIHRDLKPANVMVGDFGEVYVMDWGLAKALGSETDTTTFSRDPKGSAGGNSGKVATQRAVDSNLTQDGSIIGTPAYMPPEQARGDLAAIDERSDIYSLGAILYEIMSLSPPVGRSGDHLAILMRVMEGAIKPPEKMAPGRARKGWVPSELSAVAMKALALDPADRYPSVEALQRDIQLFMEGRSVSAKQDSAWEMFKKLVKRNKGVSIATAAALAILAVVVGFFLKINYDARVEAEDNYDAFVKADDEKKASYKISAPAFVRAAKLTASESFDDALAQVSIALDYDPDLAEGHLVRGQVLVGLERYAEAVAPLQEYLKRKPDDTLARQLADLAARPEPDRGDFYWTLFDVFSRQKAQPMADRMTRLGERFRSLLDVYRKRIEAAPGWKDLGGRLSLDNKGNLKLHFGWPPLPQVRDLTPLRGMKLDSLSLALSQARDLSPLEGMPLTWLDLAQCAGVKDLSPLRGMKLNFLSMQGLSELTTLEPLRGMPLTKLYIPHCSGITDLAPLRGMTSLTVLDCNGYGEMKIATLEPLKGMKLKQLHVRQLPCVQDISLVRDMPLEVLDLSNINAVGDFEPLRGRPLVNLSLANSRIGDLDVLKGMPLKVLNLYQCLRVEDLTPLAGLDLNELNITGTAVRDLGPIAKMKLTQLSIDGCKAIDDLTPLAGMKLQTINFTPKFIQKGMDVLRGMKSLENLATGGQVALPAAEFWKQYDKGEFKK